jgi:hypothetical protein
MRSFLHPQVLRPIAFVLLFAFTSYVFGGSACQPYASSIRIPGGTPVILELNQYLDSEHEYDHHQIQFRVKHNVIVDNQVVIAAGSIAYGHILQLNKRKGLGQPGYIEIKVDHVTAVDGTQVTLSSPPLSAEGENRDGVAMGLAVGLCCVIGPLGLLFLCIKGGPAELYPGAEINATTLYDIEVTTL